MGARLTWRTATSASGFALNGYACGAPAEGQNLVLKAERTTKNKTMSIEFHIEREGQAEDIMKGQGGSVANVLSVGLRMFALASLDPAQHRRVLVLDEQDCWLRPDLVPKLVKIVHLAGRELGFQTIMISQGRSLRSHDVECG